MQSNHSFHQVVLRNKQFNAFYMTKKFKLFLSQQRLKSMCIIFIYSKRADKRTKQRTKKQTQCHMHTPTYPRIQCEPCIMFGWTKLSIKYYYMRCNNLPQVL